jgi:phage terminase small subunit
MSKQKRVKAGTSANAAAHRRQLFIEAYMANDGNATQAAIAAGFSPKTAKQQGSRLLTNVDVQRAISERQRELEDRYKLTTDELRRSLSQVIHFDPRRLYRPDGSLKDVTELDDDTAAALAGLEVMITADKEGAVITTKKLRWLDKNTARDQAMRYRGMFAKDNEQRTDPIRELLGLIDGAKGGRIVDMVKRDE